MGGGALLAAGKFKQRACTVVVHPCAHFTFHITHRKQPVPLVHFHRLTSNLACAAPNLRAAVCHISSKKCRRRWMTACGSLPPAPLPPACACFALAPRYRQLALIQLSCVDVCCCAALIVPHTEFAGCRGSLSPAGREGVCDGIGRGRPAGPDSGVSSRGGGRRGMG